MAVLIVLLVFALIISIFYGHYRFAKLVERDKEFLFNWEGNTERPVVLEDLDHLPKIMQKYLLHIGILGKCQDCHLTLRQIGNIRRKKGSKWMRFTAEQYVTAKPMGFVWAARAFPIFVKDKYLEGKGETNITLLGLKSLMLQHSMKTDESSLGRLLSEFVLYPICFLDKSIIWEEVDEKKIKARLTVGRTTAEGTFGFNEDNLITHFESKRYKGEVLTSFTGLMGNYKTMSGFTIPTKLKAVWNLEDGDFEYFNCDIVDYQID